MVVSKRWALIASALRLGLVVLVAALLVPAGVSAATIVDVSGSPFTGIPSSASTGINGQALASSWSQTQAYSGVDISAILSTETAATTSNGMAYLMTAIGPGTTVASEVASAAFAVSSNSPASVSLFTGLSLSAGTYYTQRHK